MKIFVLSVIIGLLSMFIWDAAVKAKTLSPQATTEIHWLPASKVPKEWKSVRDKSGYCLIGTESVSGIFMGIVSVSWNYAFDKWVTYDGETANVTHVALVKLPYRN